MQTKVLFVRRDIGTARRSAARAFPRDPLNVAPRDADISELTVIQLVQLTKILIVSTPNSKHSNHATDQIHNYLLICPVGYL